MGSVQIANAVVESAIIGGDIIAMIVQSTMRQALIYGAVATAGVPPPATIPKKYYPAGVPVTARLQEVYQYRAEVTRYAIESADIASDHVILYPIEIELSCQVGNWYPQMPGYILGLFEAVWQLRSLLTLITQHQQVKNMVLREFRAENEAPVWGKLDFHLIFQQIPQVTLLTQNYTPSQTAATPQTGGADASKSANPPVNNGSQTPQPPTTQQQGDFNLPTSTAVG